MDLNLYVKGLRSRIIRTPEDEKRAFYHKQKLKAVNLKKRRASLSPNALTRSKADYAMSKILNNVKLLRPEQEDF